MPKLFIRPANEATWLPNPPSMLNEPITTERRQLVIQRFVKLQQKEGFFIYEKNNFDNCLHGWLTAINPYFKQTAKYENADWLILKFKLIPVKN